MKKILLYLFIIIISHSAYSQKIPIVSFYFENGDVRQYSLSDIDNLKFVAGTNSCLLRVFYNDTLTENYLTKTIDSIKFDKNIENNEAMYIYISGQPVSFVLADVDSINFSKTNFPFPVISNISPSSALINSEIAINGLNFEDFQGNSIVSFNGKNAVEYLSWADNQIRLIVPQGAQSGYISVTVMGSKSNKVEFHVIPFISLIFPDSAGISEYISVYGSGFGNVRSGDFSFNNAQAIEYSVWTDSAISVKVPKAAKTGKAFVKVNSIKSNEINFSVIQHISSILPDTAIVGQQIAVFGTDFGYKQGTSLVFIDGIPAIDYRSWSDSVITFIVPDKAHTGALTISINGTISNPVNLILKPFLSYITPTSARLNSTILLLGSGFGDLQDTGYVSFNGANASIYTGWSSKSIAVKVPTSAKSGKVSVTIAKIKSNETDFTVLPSLISISSSAVFIGDEIAISGISFSDIQGSNFVTFNNKNATEYASWTDTLIKVKVPDGVRTGNVFATIGKFTTNEVLFTLKPKISSISPTSGLVGNYITISGSDFGTVSDSNFVTFGSANAIVYSIWSDTLIIAKVPAGASTGKLTITVNHLKSNEVDFICTGGNYEEVKIGNQIWMLKNLSVSSYRNGDPIPEVPYIADWCNLTSGAWCYHDNDPSIGQVYGKLYNWYAVTDPRGLAPEGWHIPSDDELTALSDYLGGDDISGGKLKETGPAHWQNPNTGATNESGFTGIPGSYRSFLQWSLLEGEGFLWSTSEFSATRAWYRSLAFDSPIFNRNNQPKFHGLSVRCIKD